MTTMFEALKRIAQGKPIFDPPEDKRAKTTPPPETAVPLAEARPTTIIKSDARTFPEIILEHCHPEENQHRLRIFCMFRNTWHDEVLVQNIQLLDTNRPLTLSLRGNGGAHELMIYDGPPLVREQSKIALLHYHTHDGHHFEATFEVHYMRTRENTFEVTSFNQYGPVRHLY